MRGANAASSVLLGLVGLTMAGLLAGCSQVAAIAPVGGNHLAEVRFAGNDILVDHDIDVRTAPVCTRADDKTITCDGDTFDATPIRFSSPGSDPDRLSVVVGGDDLYDGSLAAVLTDAMSGAVGER